MSEAVIQLEGLTKDYDTTRAVDNLSLTIKKGEVFGLLGPNGAGKSTTILMILGLSEPTTGTVYVKGFDSTRSPLQVKKIVGYLPDQVGFYEDLTGLENIVYTAQLNGMSKIDAKKQAIRLLEQVGLVNAMHKKTGKYSRGMRQRLGLADVLIKNPDIIILDEPTLGLDPKGVQELLDLIQSLSKEKGMTVLLSSHQLHQVQQICDRVGLFVQGKLIAQGTIDELAKELFAYDGVVVCAKVASISDDLKSEISSLLGVESIEQVDDSTLLISCEKHLVDDIASVIIRKKVGLLELTTMSHGLDDIYHQYFEGGKISEEIS